MIFEVSLSSWFCFVALVVSSTLASYMLANYVPWTNAAIQNNFPKAFGLAIAPFLTGFLVILCLLFLPGVEHWVHFTIVTCIMIFGAALYLTKQLHVLKTVAGERNNRKLIRYLLLFLLFAWCVLLVINSCFLPLTQNDALEYAIVGRELFYSKTLSIYPLIKPESNQSGFFGAWTHPPLYVSLIYITNVIQGHANSPGLMRLISPWFLLSSTYAIVLLGRMRSQNAGLLAGILYVSTPLFFLGTGSGLIDALPVAGMVLFFLLLAGGYEKFPFYPASLGCLMGLVLLTHSESILFIPLVFAALLIKLDWNWRSFIKFFCIVFGIAFLISGAAYIRNIFLFGSPISDNPAVFALLELDWKGYFSYERGLNHWGAIIQYGILKGFFCFEAYGLVFWLGMMGYVFFLYERKSLRFWKIPASFLNKNSEEVFILTIGLVIVLLYLCGVVLSIILGIDLMIRSERYILIMTPPLALSGAFFIEKLVAAILAYLSSIKTVSMRSGFALAGLCGVYIVCVMQFMVIFAYGWRNIFLYNEKDTLQNINDNSAHMNKGRLEMIFNNYPSVSVINEISRNTAQDALVLSMKPADMYYAKRKMVSFLDPRLIPFYKEHSPENAALILKNLGIKYVHMSDYTLPPMVNSSLMQILANPNLSRLIYAQKMYQLYELKDSELKKDWEVDITPGRYPWKKDIGINVGGRKQIGMKYIGISSGSFSGGLSVSSFPVFHRHYSVFLTPNADENKHGYHAGAIPVTSNAEYILKVKFRGNGFVRFWLSQFDVDDHAVVSDKVKSLGSDILGEISLSESKPFVSYSRRFTVIPQTKFIRFTVEHQGRSQVELEEVILERLTLNH